MRVLLRSKVPAPLLFLVAALPAAAQEAPQAAPADDPLTAMAVEAESAGPVPPVDEALDDPAFFAFRARLARAVAERDTAAVLEVADPQIKLSFGGSYGRADLRDNLRDDAYWGELAAVLSLGGVFAGPRRATGSGHREFWAPYTFERFPSGIDPFEGYVVLGEDVLVRSAPAPNAEVLDSRSFEVVVRDREAERAAGLPWDGAWTAIRRPDGRSGFMASRYLRSPIDYRAGFTFRDGRWWMRIFIAGD